MDNEKKDTLAVAGQNVSKVNNSSTDSITQNAPINQEKSKGRFKKKGHKVLGINAKVYTVAFKFYTEQLPLGEQAFIDAVRNSDKRQAQVLAIKHDRDEVTDGIWEVAKVKPHWHVIVRMSDRKRRMYISTILSSLNICYRKGADDDLWKSHGVEAVGNFAGYATYLTHETDDAIQDGKELYELSEIVSNLTVDEIEQIRAGYVRVSEKRRLTESELIALDKEAFDMGYEMKNFTEWCNSQPFSVRSNTKFRTIKESYNRGVEARIEEGKEINRLCIFIQGKPNTGKTYASKMALQGKSVLSVGGGGTGKFDRLRPDHDAIVIDDDVCPNLLNMTDNYICRAYKRNNNNPAWAGEYFIVTSNLSFPAWLNSCGIHTCDKIYRPGGVDYVETAHYKAMLSRFFVCRLKEVNGINHLALTSVSTRGSVSEQIERADKFMAFKKLFDDTIAGYTPANNTVDFSKIIEKV